VFRPYFFVMRRPLALLLSLCALVASAADPVAPSRTTPLELVIKDGVETRIACDHNGGYSKYSGVYHYRVILPKGYHADPAKEWSVLFVASPGGNATLGNMADWVKKHGYIAILLDESKNGPWDPSVGNFLAAHQDAMKRFRIGPGRKVCTGFSGGARASSIFVSIGDNFGGVILQGAGTGILDDGLRGLRGVQIPAVVVTMGKKDSNRGEIKALREMLSDRLEVLEFEGGHQWAPKDTIEKALDYVHAKLPK
jgi:predicted esterase